MAKFHVDESFVVKIGKKSFVMAVQLLEGEICEGMFAYITFGPELDLTSKIDRIEHIRRRNREDIGLCFDFSQDQLDLWNMLKISNQTIEITETGMEL